MSKSDAKEFVMAHISRSGKRAFTITRLERITRRKRIIEKWICEIFHGALAPGETLKTTTYRKKFTVRLIVGKRKFDICELERNRKREYVLTIRHAEFNAFARGTPCIIARNVSKKSA